MSINQSSGLRLVKVEEEVVDAQEAFVADWNPLCESFRESTGLPLEFHTGDERPANKNPLWSAEVPAVGANPPGLFSLTKPAGARINKNRVESACALADEIGRLVSMLQTAEQSLTEREAELATAIPLVVRPHDEPTHLAKRFAAILQGGAEAVGCQAAAVYILDDTTQFLKLRCQFGLTNDLLSESPKPLKESQGDIFALAGQAVVLSDIEDREQWNIPGKFEGAVCVPISTATMPLGTLWFYADDERDFSESDVNSSRSLPDVWQRSLNVKSCYVSKARSAPAPMSPAPFSGSNPHCHALLPSSAIGKLRRVHRHDRGCTVIFTTGTFAMTTLFRSHFRPATTRGSRRL